MALTRSYPVDKAYPNASDLRKAQAAIFPREGLFPDPVTVAAAGVAYAGSGWSVNARPFTANLKRGGAPFSQTYGAAQVANDGIASGAWLLPGAPSSGSWTSLLWAKAADPTQGDALTQVAGELGPDGQPRPRAVPIFGVTTGTTTVAPTLPAGALLVATATIAATATSAAQAVITQSYDFAGVLGGAMYFRTVAAMKAAADAAAPGEGAYVVASGDTYTLTTIAGVKRWVVLKRALPGVLFDTGFGDPTWQRPGNAPVYANVATYSYTAADAEVAEIKAEAMIDPGGVNIGGQLRLVLNGAVIGAPVRVATPSTNRAPFFFSVSARGRLVEGANTISLQAATDSTSAVLYGTSPHLSIASL